MHKHDFFHTLLLAAALAASPASGQEIVSLFGDKDGFGFFAPEVDNALWRDDLGGTYWKDYRQEDDLANAPFTDVLDSWFGEAKSWTHTYDLGFTPRLAYLHIYGACFADGGMGGSALDLYADDTLIRTFWYPGQGQSTHVLDVPIPLIFIDGQTTFTLDADWGDGLIFDYMELHVLPEEPGRSLAHQAGDPGDRCETATAVTALPFTDSATTCGYADDYDEICPYDLPGSTDVVYVYSPVNNVTVDISLCTDAGYDTKLYVYQGACGSYQSGTQIACNDDGCASPSYPYGSMLSGIQLLAEGTYYIVVDGYGGYCGDYTLEITEYEPAPLDCPVDSLFSQTVELGSWTAAVSDEDSPFVCYERLWNAAGAIDTVSWWGLNAVFYDDWTQCYKQNERMEITLYQDVGGQPGAVAYGPYTVTPTKADTGVNLEGYPLYYYTASIPACTLMNGWISITGIDDGQGCWFLWMSSNAGDGSSRQWDSESGVWVSGTSWDLSICLSGDYTPTFGACCDDSSGMCDEDVELIDCVGPTMRFLPNATCADLDPPCGEPTGACCHGDGTCEIVFVSDCVGTWMGPWTTCGMCPCVVPCPPGAAYEQEACGDDTNGGCNMAVPQFEPIACGQTICGTSWALDEVRDTDWYEIEVTEDTQLKWAIEADFIVATYIVDGTAGCSTYTVLAEGADFECHPITLTACVPAGTYWFWVGPYEFSGVPCDGNYVASLTCEPCTVAYGACCSATGLCTEDVTEDYCAAHNGVSWHEGLGCDVAPCPEVPVNDTCESAQWIPVPGSVVADNYVAGSDNIPFCGTSAPEHGVWYVVTGTGNTMTVTTCSPNTEFDTKIQVFCDCNGWTCVEGNDDNWNCEADTLHSIVSWCSELGQNYYVHVGGYESEEVGAFEFIVTDDGTPCYPPVSCPAVGACCLDDGTCVPDHSEAGCGVLAGMWQGADTVCDPNPCESFYCLASGGGGQYISNVSVGDIDNPSGSDQYADYTFLSTEVAVAAEAVVTVTIKYPYNGARGGIWVDWNQDRDFDDPGETIVVAGSPGPGPYTATITPPENAEMGDTRMRTRLTWAGAVEPCGGTQYGEVEDYTIVVVPARFPGDLNCDGAINTFDIDPFVLALTDPAAYAQAYPECNVNNADINDDGSVNTFDIDPFVALLTGG